MSIFNSTATGCGLFSSTPQLCADLDPRVALPVGVIALLLLGTGIAAYKLFSRRRAVANPSNNTDVEAGPQTRLQPG